MIAKSRIIIMSRSSYKNHTSANSKIIRQMEERESSCDTVSGGLLMS